MIGSIGKSVLNGVKSMYVNRLACVKVKGGESECFRINSGVRKKCIMSLWHLNVYVAAMMKKVKIGMKGKRGNADYLKWMVEGFYDM